MCELREFGSLLFPASCALSVSGRLVEFLVLFVALLDQGICSAFIGQ
jgi:hypothetical protein